MEYQSEWLLSAYVDDNERSMARLLRNITLFSIFSTLLLAVASYFNADPVSSVALLITSAVLLVVLLALRLGSLGFASWVLPTVAFILITYEVYAVGDGTKEVQILGYPIVILFATLLLGSRGSWTFTILSAASYAAILFIHKYELLRPYELAEDLLPLDAVIAAIILALVAVVQTSIVNRLSASLNRLRDNEAELRTTIVALGDIQNNLEQLVEERTEQIAVSAEVGRVASAILNPEEVIRTAVNLITERFGYYYAAIFLVDENGIWANLTEATGEAGRVLLERQHRLQIGGRSMVGTAITTCEAKIALDAGAEPVRFDNPLLPETRSEIALPLLAGQRVLGALDVQSVEGNAFDEEDIEVLQSMANQVAVAIDNARLYQESRTRLEELNRLYKRGYESPSKGVRFKDGMVSRVTEEADATIVDLPEGESIQVRHEDGRTHVRLPFRSGGQVIAEMNLESKDHRWTGEEIALLESAAGQVSTALENAMLVQDSQARARQERELSEGTARIRETLDIEAILQTAAADIQRTLNLVEVDVQVGILPDESPTNGQD